MLVHALGDAQRIYAPALFRRLSAAARILLISWPEARNLDAAVQATLAAMDDAGVRSAIFYGTSVGGSIVQATNIEAPHRVAAMILANTALPVSWAGPLAGVAAGIVGLMPESHLRKKLADISSEMENPEEAEAAAGLLTKAVLSNWLRWAADFHGLDITQMTEESRRKPILIIETDNDSGVPKKQREGLKAFYQDAKVRCFEGGGHLPHLKFPDEYEREILGFIHSARAL